MITFLCFHDLPFSHFDHFRVLGEVIKCTFCVTTSIAITCNKALWTIHKREEELCVVVLPSMDVFFSCVFVILSFVVGENPQVGEL